MVMKTIVGIVILIVGMVAFPIMAQWRSTVINSAFKRIRIKKISFLFSLPLGCDNSIADIGISIPLFIIQLIGYIIAVATIITDIILWLTFCDMQLIASITTIILLSELVVLSISLLVLRIICH